METLPNEPCARGGSDEGIDRNEGRSDDAAVHHDAHGRRCEGRDQLRGGSCDALSDLQDLTLKLFRREGGGWQGWEPEREEQDGREEEGGENPDADQDLGE